jgi:hypothetical protein
MSRYNSNNGSSNGDNSGNDYDDQKTLKLQKYAAVRLEPRGVTANTHDQYGTSFIANFDNTEIIDGIVFQRDDKPGTWKVFSAGKFFEMNPEDGLVYEDMDDDGNYSGEMSAQDILDHPRVAGFSESFAGNDYFYDPVGVVIEEAGDIAVNDDLDVETTDSPSIVAGDASMLLGNKSWTRTLAKKMTEEGDAVISDNGDDPTPRGEPDTNPKYDDYEWLATDDPTLRKELEGRSLELWITEQTETWDDGGTTTFTVPNLLDVKTGNFVNIDNSIHSDDDGEQDKTNHEAGSDKAAATDGGTKAQSGSTTTETPTDTSGLPDDVPDKLDDLIDYMARNGETTADEIREFAEDEVDDADSIDWEAAAAEANQRAE